MKTHQQQCILSKGWSWYVNLHFCRSKIDQTYSEIKAALPSTVKRTARYKVTPQNQCPVSNPVTCFKSPQNKIIEKPYKICKEQINVSDPIVKKKTHYQAMVQGVTNPKPKRGFCEKLVLLSQDVQLRVSVQEPCRHELIEDSNNKGRQYRKHHVVQGECPRLVGNLSWEVVEEGILGDIEEHKTQ